MTTLRAALVTPLRGPLGTFGRAGAEALGLWASNASALPAPFTRVELAVHDGAADLRGAVAAAARESDLLFGPYGAHHAITMCSETTRLVWNHGGASSHLNWPRFPAVVNVLSPARSYFEGFLRLARANDSGAEAVVLFHAATRFGREMAEGAARVAEELRFRALSLAFPPGGAGTRAAEVPEGDLLLVAGGFEDERDAARVLLGRTWKACAFVGAGERDVLASLGRQREGLFGPAQWIAGAPIEPTDGPPGAWFVRAFRAATGEEPSYPAAQAFAAGVIAARCAREAGSLEEAELLAAARRLRCRTLFGDFRLDPVGGLQIGHQVLTVQWQGGRRVVVWPPARAEAPAVYPRRP